MAEMFEDTEELLRGPSAEMRADALDILRAGIEAVEPYRSIMDFVSVSDDGLTVADALYDLDSVDRVIVLGAGKAAIAMVKAVVDLLGDRAVGHVNALEDRTIGRVLCHRATHPIPGPEGVEGSRRIIEAAGSATGRDLVLCLISGGGSALMPLPEEGLTLEDKMEMTNILLKCGATIQELNCIRKHMSAIKGGKLARAASPAPITSLILSDVIGDPLDSIASGPTAPDTTSYEDARAILHRYDVWDEAPEAVRRELEAARYETPKVGDPVFEKVQNVLIGNNMKSQVAMVHRALAMRYVGIQMEGYLLGNNREAAAEFLETARAFTKDEARAVVVAGGETTVVVTGKGRGGRNQEMALVNMRKLGDGELFASVGTDGIDGKSHAAGALVDGWVRESARDMALDVDAHLAENDSTAFFEKAGGLLVTGPTGTNVADVHLYIVHRG
jgi:hydroxypyruvate reductase